MTDCVSALPELKLNSTFAKATSSGATSCADLDAVVNLTTSGCQDYCIQPDGSGSAWWEIDMATLYYITHLQLLGAGLQNLTYDVKLFSTMNDTSDMKDMEYKVSLKFKYKKLIY